MEEALRQKPYKDYHISILGFGYLMEYIEDCYHNFLGDGVSGQILGVTADEDGLVRKQEKFSFQILLRDNKKALRENRPDLILLATPPSAAASVVEHEVKEYVEECRKECRKLPVIFAFPPAPAGQWYKHVLGEDIKVVNILPNMVNRIGSLYAAPDGITYVTYPEGKAWEYEDQAMLQEFFRPLGSVVAVHPDHLTEMLAGTTAVHNVSELIFTIADALCASGCDVDNRQIASAMRAHLLEISSFKPTVEYPCDKWALPPSLSILTGRIIEEWHRGTRDFYYDTGLPKQDGDRILDSLLHLHLLKHQVMDRQVLVQEAKQHATKGGVLEKSTQIFHITIETYVKKLLYPYPHVRIGEEELKRLGDKVYLLNQIVAEHGKKLDKRGNGIKFDIPNHAAAFGLLAKHTVKSHLRGAEEALSVGVVCYARQRGKRMRQRCDYYGDPVNMLSYKAYCEWCPEDTQMESVTLQKSPVHKTMVTDCHWINDWRKYGLLEYGHYYCDFADPNLVKGFDDAMFLEMPEIYARNLKHCSFIWSGADLNEENEAWLDKRRKELKNLVTESWEYHTAHLYHTMKEALLMALGKGAERILDDFRKEYAGLFGYEALAVLDSYEYEDFTIARFHEAEGQEAAGLQREGAG